MLHESNNLVRSLSKLRRQLRAILVIDGVSRLAAAMLGTFALLAVLDWWVHFPPLVRASFLLASVVWTVGWTWKRIWRPLMRPIALDQLALSLQTLTTSQRDRLAGAVAHMEGAGHGDQSLWSRVTLDAGDEAGKLNLSLGLNPRRAVRSTVAVIAVAAVLVLVAMKLPSWMAVGRQRMVSPFANVQWPKSTEIAPLSGDMLVAHGETMTAEMRLARGDDPNQRAFIHWQTAGRPVEKAMMRRDADGVYRRLLERVTSDTTYYFSAGDDETSARPGVVRVVHRPTVASAKLTITPPTYAAHLPVREHPLSDPRVSLVRGCRVRLDIIADRSVVFGETSAASRVVVESGGVLPIQSDATVGTTGSIQLEADADSAFEIILIDENKFESRGGSRYQLDVVPDRPPAVAIKEPTGSLEVTPDATVDVLIRAEDDLGIARMSLLVAAKSTEFSLVADLATTSGAAPTSAAVTTRTGTYAWNLATLHPTVGDVIDYVAEATDFYEWRGERHKPARSAVMRLNVVSPERFAERLHQDVFALRGGLRKLLSSLEAIRSQVQQLQHRDSGDGRREIVERITGETRKLLQQADETAKRFAQINRRAEMNKAGQSEPSRQAQRLAKRLGDSVVEGVSRAAKELGRVEREASEAARREQLETSTSALKDAADGLRAMLDEVEQWDSFDEMVRKLHDLIDAQEGLARRTSRLMRQPPDAISQDAAAVAADQSVAESDASKLIGAMETLATQLQERDRPSSESLTRAAQAARLGSLSQVMTESAEAVRAMRLVEAASNQERASAVLRTMLVALREKPQRELEQLSRQVQDVRQKLMKILAVQEDLRKKTNATRGTEDATSRMTLLADREASLETTTRTLTESMKINGADADEAKDELLAASDHMAAAVTWLKDTEAVEADEAQRGAIEALKKSLGYLEKIEDQALSQLAEQSMAAIVESLKEIRTRQASLREQTAAVDTRLKGREGIPRADGLTMNRLAKEQAGLLEPLGAVRAKIEKSVVYDYVCGQVGEAMKAAGEELVAHRCTPAMARQDQALKDLSRLIEAVDDAAKKDDPRFASENAGGGGLNKPTPSNPVPTLAELKILRLLQTELNTATTDLHQKWPDAAGRGEDQVKQVDSLGISQRRIQEMAQKMIEKAGGQ
ncbi:MAG: hypothetical protein AABZ08_08435 [Planctomycetota bacterium]